MAMTVPPGATRRWTRREYERLVELGVFRDGEALELLDGLLVVREPQGASHATAVRLATRALERAFGPGWDVRPQLPIALDADSEPEPDVAVVAGEPRDYRRAHPERPVLVVEVAGTSDRLDREYKTSLYARAGIVECWIVDLAAGALEIHREPVAMPGAPLGWRYRAVDVVRPPAVVTPLTTPAASVSVADLLP